VLHFTFKFALYQFSVLYVLLLPLAGLNSVLPFVMLLMLFSAG
jgi:hypothetical protein